MNLTPELRAAIAAVAAALAALFAILLSQDVIDLPGGGNEVAVCTPVPCVSPLGELSLNVVDGQILVQFPAEPVEAVALFWMQESGPINRFDPPDWTDTEAPYEFTSECGNVVDVMVILPVSTPQDTGGARRLLQADVEC